MLLSGNRRKLPMLILKRAKEWDFTGDASGGNTGDDIADSVADILINGLVVVERIGLSRNGITDKGAKDMARALRVKSPVQHLDLSHNSIGIDGARAIADALEVNSTVESLNLSYNSPGVDELLRNSRVDQLLLRNKQFRMMNRGQPQVPPQYSQQTPHGPSLDNFFHNFRLGHGGQSSKRKAPAPAPAPASFHQRENNVHGVAESSSKATPPYKKPTFQAPATPPAPPPATHFDAAWGTGRTAGQQATHCSGGGHGGEAGREESGLRNESGQATRHTLGIVGIVGASTYVRIKDFMKDFKPSKLCSQYIEEDCSIAFEILQKDSTTFLSELIGEATRITQSLMGHTSPPAGDWSSAFAIVSYTVDLRAFGARKDQDFYNLINLVLQSRKMEILEHCQGYLHYLFKGLQALPPMSKQTFYRGLPPEQLDLLREHYRRNRAIHWSGLSSVSESKATAWQFATPGGVVIRVVASSARSIDRFSAYAGESEALLLPNFRAMVREELHKEDGRWYVDIEENYEVAPHVF